MKANAPCKDCEDREVGCHSKCMKYQEWSKKRNDFLDEMHRQKQIKDVLLQSEERRCKSRSESNGLNRYREVKRRNYC